MLRLVPAAALLALVALTGLGSARGALAEDDLVHIRSRVAYDIHPDQGPVHVSWDISIQNNDPQTTRGGGRRTSISYYDAFSFPVLAGASSVTARSAAGAHLDVAVAQPVQGLVTPATVKLDKQLFYQDTYDLRLEYAVPETRREALIVTPAYAFVPLVASGDEATVEVSLPEGGPWSTSVEAGDCTQSGASFTCAGADSVFLAGVAEAARPDLTATLATDVQLRDKKVAVSITYFQGEEAFAQHVSDLAVNALPVIEDIYGFTYSGADTINVSERVRQVILGYEGLTRCDAAACEVNISPIADDYTVLHEFAHLWSGIYAKRWLAEGFAQYVSIQAAAYLPEGLVSGAPPDREQPSVDLRLDDWGEVTSIIGAAQEDLAVENAGYYRSLRFLEQLDFELGLETLRKANQAISQGGVPADSRRFMDVLEDVSGRNNDGLFLEWVFPDSLDPLLADRREARDRLTNLIARVQEEGLTEDVPARIEGKVKAWQFDEAFEALDKAEAGLDTYDRLKGELEQLRNDVSAAGLVLSDDIDRRIADWDFEGARALVQQAAEAVSAYNLARAKVAEPRSLWERFGLLGSDPEGSVERAAAAFNDGEYQAAIEHAKQAIDTVDGASATAVRRILILAGVLALFALVILVAVWLSHRREPDFA